MLQWSIRGSAIIGTKTLAGTVPCAILGKPAIFEGCETLRRSCWRCVGALTFERDANLSDEDSNDLNKSYWAINDRCVGNIGHGPCCFRRSHLMCALWILALNICYRLTATKSNRQPLCNDAAEPRVLCGGFSRILHNTQDLSPFKCDRGLSSLAATTGAYDVWWWFLTGYGSSS